MSSLEGWRRKQDNEPRSQERKLNEPDPKNNFISSWVMTILKVASPDWLKEKADKSGPSSFHHCLLNFSSQASSSKKKKHLYFFGAAIALKMTDMLFTGDDFIRFE